MRERRPSFLIGAALFLLISHIPGHLHAASVLKNAAKAVVKIYVTFQREDYAMPW